MIPIGAHLPNGWQWKKVGQVCDFLDSQRIPLNNEDRENRIRGKSPADLYPYYGANGQVGWIDDFIFNEPLILLAEDGGHFGSTEKPIAYSIHGKTWVNNHAHVLRPKNGCIDFNYCLYALMIRPDVEQLISGTTRGKLNQAAAAQIHIPIPPLEEQKRIAAILEEADNARRTRRFTQSISDNFLQEVFVEMFGLPDQNWLRTKVAQLATNMRTGPFGSQLLHSEFVNEGVAVLGIDNAVQNRFAWDELRFITNEKYKQLKRYTVYPGDILITIMGTTGRCAIVPDNIPLAINTKHLCCITLDHTKCIPIYLKSAFLYHPEILKQIGISQRGAIMDGLNMGIIKALDIAVPPMSLQLEYAEIVSEYEKVFDQQHESERQTEHLFQTLLHRAFRGEL